MTSPLDWLLGPRLRELAGEELYRARLILLTIVLIAAAGLVLVPFVVVLSLGPYLPALLPCCSILIGIVWWVRRTGQIETAAIATCVVFLATVVYFAFASGGLDNTALHWTVLVALYAPFVMRPMRALVLIGLAFATTGAVFIAAVLGYPFSVLANGPTGFMVGHSILVVLIGGLGLSYDRSRRQAFVERDAAYAALEESRISRLALVENVNAVIFSVDRELRLIAGNSLFERLSHAAAEEPIRPGEPVLTGLGPSQRADLEGLFARALAGEHFTVERRLELRSGTFDTEIMLSPIRRASGEIRGVIAFGRDISERIRARAELQRLHRDLADAARLAGKAEVARDMLHNVGNVLVALKTSQEIMSEQLERSSSSFLGKTVDLLPVEPAELARFLTTDVRGAQIRPYLAMLSTTLATERTELLGALEDARRQLEHVEAVIARQQAYAHADSRTEVVSVDAVISEAIALQRANLARHGISVVKEVAQLPPIAIDRHKLIEILTNYLTNSRAALQAAPQPIKRIEIRAFETPEHRLQIDVTDNGIGIAPEHLARLFSYGFTTRSTGHGIGLASSLYAAKALGGTARGRSDGPGMGATFTVDLPLPAVSATDATKTSSEQAA